METVVCDINSLVLNAGKSEILQHSLKSIKSLANTSKMANNVKLNLPTKETSTARIDVEQGLFQQYYNI